MITGMDVLHDEDGEPLGVALFQQIDDLLALRFVKAGCDFVQQQQRGAGGQGPGRSPAFFRSARISCPAPW